SPPPQTGSFTFHSNVSAVKKCRNYPPTTANDQCDVACQPPPKVLCAAHCSPVRACTGATITVTGSATNPANSGTNEDIVLTVEGKTQTFTGVHPGQTVSFTNAVLMPSCSNGQQVPFHVSAVATNQCP